MKLFILFLFGLVLSRTSFAADPNCGKNWAILDKDAVQVAQDARVHQVFQNKNIFLNTARRWRDQLRTFIMRINGNEYPLMALDDGTPLKAYILMNNTAENIPKEVFDSIKPEDIKTEVAGLLKQVHSYSEDLKQIQLDAANAYAKQEALERTLAKTKDIRNEVDVEIPQFKWGANGELAMDTPQTLAYTSMQRLQTEYNAAKNAVDRATLEPIGPWGRNSADDRSVLQAISLKKLETYWKELRTAESRLPQGTSLPADIIQLKEQLSALYANIKTGEFAPELKPSLLAWQRVRFLQMTAELQYLFWKKVPSMGAELDKNAFFAAFKALSEDEQKELLRRLGLNHAAESEGIIAQSGPITRIVTLVTATGGTGFGGIKLVDLVKFWLGRGVSAQKCAQIEDSDSYAECLQKYVDSEFPGKAAFAHMTQKSLINPTSADISDPKILAALQNIQTRHFEYLRELREKRESLGLYKKMASAQDPNSSTYQQHLAENKDQQAFVLSLVGTKADGSDGYLGLMYPLSFQEGRTIAQEILNMPAGSAAWNNRLADLQKISPDLAQLTRRMAEMRQVFLHPETKIKLTAEPEDGAGSTSTTDKPKGPAKADPK